RDARSAARRGDVPGDAPAGRRAPLVGRVRPEGGTAAGYRHAGEADLLHGSTGLAALGTATSSGVPTRLDSSAVSSVARIVRDVSPSSTRSPPPWRNHSTACAVDARNAAGGSSSRSWNARISPSRYSTTAGSCTPRALIRLHRT